MNYFIIDQTNPHTGEFDEHKIIIGANIKNAVEAALVYLSNYEPDWKGLGAISEATPHIFDLWLKLGNRKAPFSNSDFAEKPLHLSLVGDAAPDPSKSRHWITTETGSHILINGNGEVVAGAGGKLAGKKFSVPAGSKDVSKHIETVEKIAQAGYEKHGGDKAEYLRLGTKKGSSSHFAREYEKKGLEGLPEGHLREAMSEKPADNAAANGGQSRASTDTNLLKTAFKKTLEDPLSNNKVFEAYKSMKGVRYNTEQWKKMREQSIEKMEKAENDYFNIDNVLDEHYKKMQKLGVTDYAKNSRKANELEEKKRKIENDWLNALSGLALSTERLTNRKPTKKEIAQAIDRKNQEDNPALSGLKALAEEYGTNNNLQANKETATLSSPSQNEANNKKEGSIMSVLNFGKHNGETIEQVAKDDPGYISWLYTEPDILNKNPGLEAAIEPFMSERAKLERKRAVLKQFAQKNLDFLHPYNIQLNKEEKQKIKDYKEDLIKKYGEKAVADYDKLIESSINLIKDYSPDAFYEFKNRGGDRDSFYDKNNKKAQDLKTSIENEMLSKKLKSVEDFIKLLGNPKELPENSKTKIDDLYVTKRIYDDIEDDDKVFIQVSFNDDLDDENELQFIEWNKNE